MGAGRPRDEELDGSILEAARAVMRDGGLDALSIAEVARRAGVGRPTVYRRYADRTELALAVLYHDLELVVQRALERVDAAEPLLDQLAGIVEPFFVYYEERPGLAQALIQLTVMGQTEWNRRLQEQVWIFLGQVGARVEGARQRGELGADIDPGVVAQAYFAFYFSIVIGGFQGVFPDVAAQVTAFRVVMGQHLRGLRDPG